ncbi:MAG: CPBP family intramembrane metalloprotease [Oscillospiraceae bacterium]|nr:CPBP family intramembrane metalloprotease [Oscillospiraceae bacterium]
MISCKNNNMLIAAREARFKPKWILQILLFAAVFTVGNAITSAILIGPTVFAVFSDKDLWAALASGDVAASASSAMSSAMSVMGKPWLMLISLFATAATTLACFVYCRKIERRSWESIGFRKRGWIGSYLKGYAIGTAMLLLCALILWLMGELDFAFAKKIPVFYIFAFFVGFVIQGMSEEVLLRGYFMVSLSNRCHMAIAVAISSVAFSALHLANPGISLLALLNLTLFGVFMAVYVLRTDDLWGVCAIHSAWNFAQGNLVGISVSGNAQMPTVAVMNPVGKQALFHGGDFGLEGGLVVTLMLVAAIVLTLFLPQSRKNVKEEEHQ